VIRRGGPGTRPKVIHVTTVDMSLDLLLRPQLEAFAAAGYDVVGASAPGPHVASLEAAGIRHVAVESATRAMDPRRDLRFARELYRLFRRERPDIVHTHNPKPGWFGRMAARAARVPVVVNTVHGLYAGPGDPWPRRTVVYALERVAAACSDAELLQSSEDVAVLRRLRVPARRIQVLGNGIDLTRFRPPTATERAEARRALDLADDQVAVGAVGRLVWEKGLRELFAAATELRTRHPEAVVVVAGGLDEEKGDALRAADLDRIAAETGIRFLGEVREVERYYWALDAYVLASYREGFPRSAMEAAASGLPVVATDIRGCRQAVDHERTGLLVPVRDAEALAGALVRLVAEPDTRARMAEGGLAKARADFDQQRVIEITLTTYRRLLDRT
jgi:glycosyltransferase involved in cell wall biosynthesis